MEEEYRLEKRWNLPYAEIEYALISGDGLVATGTDMWAKRTAEHFGIDMPTED